ncbi:MAG: UvrD-helicase domain-containing protein [Patescibacteria group bacterium]
MSERLSELNESQREAVEHRDGPLLVVAGAGAGKTRTIAYRINHLIESGVKPEEILAVTFTNKAAREMLERVLKLMGLEQVRQGLPRLAEGGPLRGRPTIATFHTLGASIIREEASALGLNRHFTIADHDDSLSILKKVIKELGLDPERFSPRSILHLISQEKGEGISLKQYATMVNDLGQSRSAYLARVALPVWEKYESELARRGALDFDDLLLRPVLLFNGRPDILKRYQDRWHYLLIDEYQDTNLIQYQLARLLAGERRNICAVGDLDQAIYSWRGADCRHLLRFELDYPGAKIVTLEENYRSTKAILEAANQIISKNLNRVEKTLYTNRHDGERLSVLTNFDERAEATAVAEKVAALIERGVVPDQIAILYRANFQSRVLEEAMLQAGLPYRVLGTRFFERKEIKDVLAYLKAALNPADLESFERALGSPSRGLGKVALAKIFAGQGATLPAGQRQKLEKFKNLLSEISAAAAAEPVSRVISRIIKHSGLMEALAVGGAEDRERLENVEELVSVALKYDHLPPAESAATLLADAALVSDQDSLEAKKKPSVNLMTVHAAKGLEFDQVFIVGLEQGLFPHERFGNEADPNYDPEEERRLFYVALTRARDKLHLSYAEVRTIYGSTRVNQPSEFLLDLDSSLFEETIYVG